jgi:ADP-heptose:LPS heptosyltransferase
VLLFRYDRLGDAIITTPLIEALHRIAPHAEIDVIASETNRALFELDPRIGRVFLYENSPGSLLRLLRICRARRYDAVFQLILNNTTVPAIVAGLIARGGRTIGKRVPGHERLLDHAVVLPDAAHFRDRTLMLLTGGIELAEPLPPLPYSIAVPESARTAAAATIASAGLTPEEFLLLNISSSTPLRELTDEANVKLARGLAGTGRQIAVIAAPGAADRSRAIAERSGPGVRAIAFASLHEMVAGVELAGLVVTPDTGIVHVASATGRPTVAIYARNGDPKGWGPYGVPHRIVQGAAGNSLDGIEVGDVLAATWDLLGEIRGASTRP